MPLPPAPDSYTADYRPDLGVLVMRWLRPHSLPETQASYQHLLALARRHRCPNWLLDGRRDGPLVLETARWLGQDFLPAVARELAPELLRLAVFSSPARLEQRLLDAEVSPAVAEALAPTQPYRTALFLDEGEALAWLTASQP
ncbi:hypothetical protein [Hymenobacter rubripertinctus]|uniref:STAS/SEC14 domain-containing protein n=1 Tax=Hymenobacter rubripertinctus TaxID=2029981 RepID=A0A418QXY5_9BACT|nr:hypothetical protein [Hymenobacter rubripertinctus]RIY10046.1 hypothetical protein D0T11_10935 [Hymenobacter rubripertinctus]